jgi:4-hydroxy-2-oxoheptanedioate aldolase|tara:strand:- start:3974 stop:4747 length:774 start_codon:yes stop_codon:yes gene_type:complete
MYLNIENKLLQQINDLKKSTNFFAIKAEYEAEGSDNEEIQYLRAFTKAVNLKLFVKIGGVEAKNDIFNCIKMGVDGIIAPMVESKFGVYKFIEATREFNISKKIFLAINIETQNGVQNINQILDEAKTKIHGITIGRSDLSASYFTKKITADSSYITDKISNLSSTIKDKYKFKLTIGGSVNKKTLKIFKKNKIIRKNIDKIETRKIIFKSNDLINKPQLLKKALDFEKNYIRLMYEFTKTKNNKRLERLKKLSSRL